MYLAPAESAFGCLVAAEAVRRRNPHLGLPRPSLSGQTLVFSISLETKGADLFCQSHNILRALTARKYISLPGDGSLTHPLQSWILPGCPLRSLHSQEFPLSSPPYSPSWSPLMRSSPWTVILTSHDPTRSGEIHGAPSRAPYSC